MRLYNTLNRREEEFSPAQGNTARMYACGLTVYARGHIGNFRTFVAVDVLRRALKYQAGFGVREVVNFTDVDDRTILESQKAGVPLRDYTGRYIEAFLADAAALGLEKVEENPRATDPRTSRRWAQRSRRSRRTGTPTRATDRSTSRSPTLADYGKLARLDHEGIKSGARVDSDKYEKEDARDFVLWKATKPDEPTWDPGVGPGRPGWHIECSAMALRLLGPSPIDIHCGGVDLIFPHHENEIAQSEGATGQQFSRFWFHVEHLMIEEEDKGPEKMSKSLGNVYNLEDIVARGFRPSALRYLYLGCSLPQAAEILLDGDGPGGRVPAAHLGFPGPGWNACPQPRRRRAAPRSPRAWRKRKRRSANKSPTTSIPRPRSVSCSTWFARLNTSIDNGELTSEDSGAIRNTFDKFDRVLGVLVAAPRGRRASARSGRRDRTPDRGAPCRAAGPQLRGR